MPSVKVIKRETRHMPAFGHACPASPYQWEFEDSLVVGLALVAGMDYPEAHAIAEQALDRLSVREGEGAKAYASRRMADFHARRDAGLPPRWAKVNRVLGFSRVTDGPPPGDYTEADIQPRMGNPAHLYKGPPGGAAPCVHARRIRGRHRRRGGPLRAGRITLACPPAPSPARDHGGAVRVVLYNPLTPT
jgi:hypothetical protein